MKHEEYENICSAVKAGKNKYLKHLITKQVGKVATCRPGDLFDVEIGGEHKSWARDNVVEGS